MAELGSPPRMRGKRKRIKKDAIANRITPADAGKTQKVYQNTATTAGSPPRMRGKREYEHSGRETNRITPADAGKTISHRCRRNLR